MNPRESTRSVAIGGLQLGGNNHILVQSMCNIKTSRYEEVSAQINRCADLGAELMRVSVLDFEDAAAIKEIKKRIRIPLVADIHMDYRLALASP
jgi:(E)-4-hydroxy-3-methylbut-2-enyl-diphosphate synthase